MDSEEKLRKTNESIIEQIDTFVKKYRNEEGLKLYNQLLDGDQTILRFLIHLENYTEAYQAIHNETPTYKTNETVRSLEALIGFKIDRDLGKKYKNKKTYDLLKNEYSKDPVHPFLERNRFNELESYTNFNKQGGRRKSRRLHRKSKKTKKLRNNRRKSKHRSRR